MRPDFIRSAVSAAVLLLSAVLLLAGLACSRSDAPAVGSPSADRLIAWPTPAPTLTAPIPTPAPTFTPTVIPTPTGAPAPVLSSPLPSLPPPPAGPVVDYYSLQNALALEQDDPDAAAVIMALPWVADGVALPERKAAEALIYLAATQRELFRLLAAKPWVNRPNLGPAGPVIVGLDLIAVRDSAAAGRLAAMPFLDRLEPTDSLAADSLAVKSLSLLAHFDLAAFQKVMRHPTVGDGITDAEARIIVLLDGVNQVNPALVETLLDPAQTRIEQRVIELPRAGPVTLAIIRTRDGVPRSMDLLEHAVRSTESFIGQPFPVQYVALLFADAVAGPFGGSNYGLNLVIRPAYDVADASHEAAVAPRVIAHEVAHYYWHGAAAWLDEGAAEFTAALVERARSGRPLAPANYPCGPGRTIGYLETRDYPRADPGHVCNYAVGERIFLDLYDRLGEEVFRRGFQLLYRAVSASGHGSKGSDGGNADSDQTVPVGVAQLQAAFAEAASGSALDSVSGSETHLSDVVEQVVARWYSGGGPVANDGPDNGPDNRPVVAELPDVGGWINRAYVGLNRGGPPVAEFSAGPGQDWAWLTLEYSYDYAGPPRDLTFEVVEYYEDGFPYRRDTFTVRADGAHSGGIHWLTVGPGPQQAWAPGRHWVIVNHQGRKVAQVEFEVIE